MAWWNKLKKSTPEQEEEFAQMLEDEKLTWKDRLAMVLGAYIGILLPCTIILVAVGLLVLWIFGAL